MSPAHDPWNRGAGVPSRARLTALLLTAGALAGCRTASAPRSARDLTLERAEPGRTADSYSLDTRPRLVVTSSGDAYLVLGAGPSQMGDRLAWNVTYAASPDRALAQAPDARQRLTATADALLGAFQFHAEAAQADLFTVVAVFGTPGGGGVAEQITYARDGQRWRPGAYVQLELARAPAVPVAASLSPREIVAPGVALEFLRDVDAGDYDAAWALSSAVIKATISRVTFERQLSARPQRASPASARRELYRSFPVAGALVPGAEMEVWFALPAGARPTLQSVRLRLDDDLEWRVAAIEQVLPSAPEQPTAPDGSRRV